MGPVSTLELPLPDQRNYAWRDYGNRVGLWRIFDMMDEFGAPMSHNTNSTALEYHPEILARIKKRGDELIGSRPICSRRPATITCSTGPATTSRSGSARVPARSSKFPIRSR